MTSADYSLMIKRLLFAFTLFVLSRIGFYFYNFDYFQGAALSETLWAFVVGLRFDLATALIANLFFILGSLIPFRSLWYKKLLKIVFVVSNTVYLGFIMGDYEFFNFNGKKLTYDLFLMGGEVQDQSLQLILNYWYLSAPVVALALLMWFLYPRANAGGGNKLAWYKSVSISLLLFVLTGIGIRGGLQLRSISPKQAFVFKNYELGNFALNSAYTLVRSFGAEGAEVIRFYSSDTEALDIIKRERSFAQSVWGHEKQNVVILIVESLSQEYVEQGYAPFVSSLAEKGLSFEHNFANGRRSMEALPSIMASFPSIIGSPLYQTQYQSNKFHPLPRTLKEAGYSTAFYHGGKRGTMDFDAYCYSIGFEEYHALEDYPASDHFDGHWGVYDHHYLEHVAGKLGEFKDPFFAGIFTLSSHQPYSIPDSLRDKFPEGTLPIHESIGYADFALKTFFDKIKDTPWYKNTLFIITADHTQKLATKKYQSLLGRYRVPLIFFHPSVELKRPEGERVTQHVDILPSVLDFLNIDYSKSLYYGSSVFNNDEGRMLNLNSAGHFLLKGRSMVAFDGQRAKYYEVGQDYLALRPSERQDSDLLSELKAIIQYTNNGLRNNNIFQVDLDRR